MAQARRISDLQKPVPSPNVTISVSRDLLDEGHDMDSRETPAKWIRGKITNVGDRGVENCRLKILNVEGPNIPYPQHVTKITNGFLQWEGGIRDTLRLNPGESWIFDIGTRRFDRGCDLRLWAYFRPDSVTQCNLGAPGIYTLTLCVYGNNIQAIDRVVRIAIGEDAKDIRFPP